MKCPTEQEVRNADRRQICEWWRFLTTEQLAKRGKKFTDLLHRRFNQFGGFDTKISKEIGWDER